MSCGPTCTALARALTRPAEADALLADPAGVVGLEHRHLSSWRGPLGPRPPWPRALGTSPWSVAASLTATGQGAAYATHLLPRDPARALERVRVAVAAAGGDPVAVYVGSRLLPRHVVLVLGADGDSVDLHEPAAGQRLQVRAADLATGGAVAGWPRWWAVVSPRQDGTRRAGLSRGSRRARRAARRTRA